MATSSALSSVVESDVGRAPSPVAGVAAQNRLIRRRINSALREAEMPVIANASAPDELIAEGMNPTPTVLILSTAGSDGDTHAAITPLLQHFSPAQVILVVPAARDRQVRKALKLGARGVVAEEQIEHALAATVRAVNVGQLCTPAPEHRRVDRQPLSYRERQVLGMVVMGFTNGEIAGKLYLAESTVKSHLSSAFGKLGVRSRSEAAALILDPSENVGVGILTIPTEDATIAGSMRRGSSS